MMWQIAAGYSTLRLRAIAGEWQAPVQLSISRTDSRFLILAVFGGMEFSEPAVPRAESLGCDSLGWSAQRAAPGPLIRFRVPSSEFRVPLQPGTRNPEPGTPNPNAEPSDGLSCLGEGVGDFDLGLRSRTRSSPGYNRTGLQPSMPDKQEPTALAMGRTIRF